ncbi:MAG TPA: histidine phosphatase family protein [Candidatus Binatus sp.]|uniref:histidine phosphatase family protein n=1 Tax=Candidatus Binatus sp. TaxID=2811406 RepID=UPI002B45976D|nr:histidine phosphatase family protein [Candidatus Binatus sp.]HKN14314.1 histidine phosphatase family protein [Candidatus Binatus sp.]
MGKLIMVRHGESEGNAIRRFTTSGDAKITELGRRQALEAAQRIKQKFQPVQVIASTFTRARETGLIIAAELGIPIEYEAEFREMSLGDLAGQPYDSIANDPTFDPKRSWAWRAPHGESHEDVLRRVAPVLDRVAGKFSDDEIVIVSHGGVMRAVWAHVTGEWESAHVPPNCGIVVIEHHGGRYREPEVVYGETPAQESGG